jgi:hypothetical protein
LLIVLFSKMRQTPGAGVAGALAMRTGSKELGDIAARQFEEITSPGDTKLAVHRLEAICMKYGVQPATQKSG